jgi:DHA3 family tetracycline resistance protein-like MFS transporter
MDQLPSPIEPPAAPVGERGVRILRPLRIRDFALLFGGTTVSLFGDGIYIVALAWQVYDLSNVPTALSAVGVAWTLPMVVFLLIGGVLGDRFDRRRLMIAGDAIRAVAIAAIAVLALAGVIELWHVIAFTVLYGVGDAIFAPNFQAVVPDVVPQRLLVEANSLQQLAEPVAFRFAGPAIGGLLVAALGTGAAFAVDAGTFVVSMVCVALMRPLPVAREDSGASVLEDIREGTRFVRSQPWLWGTLLSAALTLLLFLGPFEVLLPFIVRNELGGDADVLGVILGASGVGAIVSGVLMGQRGLGRRFVLRAYVGWGVAVACLVGYPLATAAWQAVLIGFVSGLAFTVGNVIWVTMIHRYVPTELLARVSALDWMVSIGLTPISFAIAGPIAEAIGVEATMIGAGVLAAIACFAFLAVPGIRDPERWEEDAARASAAQART